MKINNSDFKDAIKVLTADFSRYGKGKLIPTNDYERGYIRGLECAIEILKNTQSLLEDNE